MPVQSINFSMPSFGGADELADLGSVLTSLSGVAGITMDQAAHTVSVEYDPEFTDGGVIAHAISGSGYEVETS